MKDAGSAKAKERDRHKEHMTADGIMRARSAAYCRADGTPCKTLEDISAPGI
jgi:hypothetical protein